MKRFQSELQPDAIDCGTMLLKMIAKYYGKLNNYCSFPFT